MLAEPGALDRAMSRVGNESVRLHRLVNSMLELARDGETRAARRRRTSTCLRSCGRWSTTCARRTRNVGSTSRSVRSSTRRWRGDPARIHQAVLNLGANACTHTAAHTPITIAVESTTAALTVSVIDHGAGIDEAEQKRIFLPFYRIDPSRVRNGHSGAGLGLAVTQQIAHEHHGSISIHPTPAGGATFTLRLPQDCREADT